MNESQITRISSTTNAAVVQLPERKYPGIVIQGDSLQNLHSLIVDAHKHINAGNIDECSDIIAELEELLGGYLQSYRHAVKEVR